MPDHSYFANVIWQIADLLRGPYRPPQYERVMLPMTVLRRFDCVLAPTKAKVLVEYRRRRDRLDGDALDSMLNKVADQRFHNHSELDFEKLQGDPDNIAQHLVSYIQGFSSEVRRIFEYFEFEAEIEKMREANILYMVVSQFRSLDLHPEAVPNREMGLIFENLIRRFNELANETAGDHFTPREVIRLMVSVLFINDDELLTTRGVVRKLLDPACGTGGMLAEAQSYLRGHHPEARLYVYGQDYNKRAYATAASDMLMKEVSHSGVEDNVRFGDSLTDDRFEGETYDYLLTNPPFGVDWKRQQGEVKREHEQRGLAGRFGAGLPRVNDGSLLFLQHMVAKFEPVRSAEHRHGSRLAIVFSGSPLFAGGAGSGESNIRRWIIENDWLEAIIALPEQMFYNTGIGTYIWIVTNRKEERRKGWVQLLDARDLWTPGGGPESRRSLGDKRRHFSDRQIDQIVRLYGSLDHGSRSKWFRNIDFGYRRVTVERPLRLRYQMTLDGKERFLYVCPELLDDVQAIDVALGREPMDDWNTVRQRISDLLRARRSRWKKPQRRLFRDVFTTAGPQTHPVRNDRGDGFEPDPALRDFENVPLAEDVDDYFAREVRPHVPDAWMDRPKDKIGYEINFNRHFYRYTPPRPLEEVDANLKRAEADIVRLLRLTRVRWAVTRGTNPDVPLRDSGLPWLGQIPAHWEIWKLGHAASVGNGSTPSRSRQEYWEDGEIPWLNSGAVNQGEITSADQFVTMLAVRECHLPKVASGAVLVAITGQGTTRGRAAVLSIDATINQHLAYIIPKPERLTPWYLRWMLFVAYEFLRGVSDDVGGTKGALTCEQLRSLRVPVPPVAEQRNISQEIGSQARRVDELIAAADSAFELIKERHSTLISAMITGQIHTENSV